MGFEEGRLEALRRNCGEGEEPRLDILDGPQGVGRAGRDGVEGAPRRDSTTDTAHTAAQGRFEIYSA